MTSPDEIVNYGNVSIECGLKIMVAPDTIFMVTRVYGPSLAQVVKSGRLIKSDKIKVAIEVLKNIEKLHEYNVKLGSISLDSIHFEYDLDANIEAKNRIIITNFDRASKQNSDWSFSGQIEDLCLISSLILSLNSGADVSEFNKEIAMNQEPNFSKLIFILKKQMLPECPDLFYSWERKPRELEGQIIE